MWDPHQDQKWLPADKQETLRSLIQSLLHSRVWNLESARSLRGHLAFASFVIPLGRLHSRRIQRQAIRLRKLVPHQLTSIHPSVLFELEWWLNSLSLKSQIFPQEFHFFVSTDASEVGWGDQFNNSTQSGLWSADQLSWHLNRKELYAARQALIQNLPVLVNSSVLVQSDNRTVVPYLRKQGGTKSLALLRETEAIFLLAQANRIFLAAQFILRVYNTAADSLSCQKLLPDWHLLPVASIPIFEMWGVPTIDLLLLTAWRSSTWKTYQAPSKRWLTWASSNGVSPNNPSPSDLGRYTFATCTVLKSWPTGPSWFTSQ